MSYSTEVYAENAHSDASQQTWLKTLNQMIESVNVTSQEVTGLLVLISSSLMNKVPLPPYLKAPPPYRLVTLLGNLDSDILSIHHFMEPGYAAFAVTQVASRLISDDLEKLLK